MSCALRAAPMHAHPRFGGCPSASYAPIALGAVRRPTATIAAEPSLGRGVQVKQLPGFTKRRQPRSTQSLPWPRLHKDFHGTRSELIRCRKTPATPFQTDEVSQSTGMHLLNLGINSYNGNKDGTIRSGTCLTHLHPMSGMCSGRKGSGLRDSGDGS